MSSKEYQKLARNGIIQQFDDNRVLWLQECYGKREGECKFWASNGRCWQREFYQDGKREGEVKLWYVNGIPHIKTFYKEDTLQGVRKEWSGDGELLRHIFYRNGRPIDYHFTLKKKLSILRFRNLLQNHVCYPINTLLISDLGKLYPQ